MRCSFRVIFLASAVISALYVAPAASVKAKSIKSDQRCDPIVGGKPYGAGAIIKFTQKGVDFISMQMNNLLTTALRTMSIPAFDAVTEQGARLTIDSMRVGEYSAVPFRYDMPHRNRFDYWTDNNRLTVSGQWGLASDYAAGSKGKAKGGKVSAYYPYNADSPTPTPTETGRVTMISGNAGVNVTTEFRRTVDGKPSLEFVECEAKFDRWTVDYVPAKPEFVKITSDALRDHLEDTTCQLMRDYFVEVIGACVSALPSRIPLTGDKKFVLDYDLPYNQISLGNKSMKGDLKGQVLWHNYYTAPFWPAYETSNPDNGQNSPDRMASFRLGDYVFNTLLHHAYWHDELRMSAFDSIPESSPLRDRLRLRCPSTGSQKPSCFGDVFGNATDNFPPTAMGDLIFKPDRRPPTVFIRSAANGISMFDAYGGWLEAHVVDGDKRQLLARTNVAAINGDFFPTISDKMNITGTVRLTQFHLAIDVARFASQMKSIDTTEEWREQLAQLAKPIFEHLINAFFNRMQLPLYLPTSLECVPPANFRLTERTMNVECDMRPLIGQPMFLTLNKARKEKSDKKVRPRK